MANIHTLMPSSYLKKEDCVRPQLVTIRAISVENVAPGGQPPENKPVMYFNEHERGLVMNSTNLQLAAVACKSDETDDWIGQSIVLYCDPNVSYAGKLTGGLRLRASRQAAAPAAPVRPPARTAPPPAYQEPSDPFDEADDIPF